MFVLARCKDQIEFKQLKEHGATQVIVSMYEESLKMVQYLLQSIHIPSHKITEMIQTVRNKDYEPLREIFPSFLDEGEVFDKELYEHLRPVYLYEEAYAVGCTLNELDLPTFDVEIVAIRRGEMIHMKPFDEIQLQEGDILVLSGRSSHLDKAERRILKG